MNNLSLIDEQTFSDLRDAVGDDFLPELILAYLEETPMLLRDLQAALAASDISAFTRAAHSIKSSSASLGALEFSAQAKELELIGKSGDLSQAGDKVDRLAAKYPELEAALKDHL